MANYAFVENNQILGVYDLLPQNWKNISNFYLIDDWDRLRAMGWYRLEKVVPDYDPDTQKLDNATQWFENGQAYETYQVIDQNVPSQAWREVIAERDKRIKDFQWHLLRYQTEIDNNQTPTEDIVLMNAYMDALNSVLDQPDPNNIEWPVYIK